MSNPPITHSGTTNQAVADANTGRKVDTQSWPTAQRETYEAVHASQTKK